MNHRKIVLVLAALLLAIAGCSGDDDTAGTSTDGDVSGDVGSDPSDSDPSDGDTSDGDSGDGDTATPSEMGSITVNGDVYAVTTLNRCEPFSGNPDDIDLQALGGGVKINLYVVGGSLNDVSIDGSTVTAEYGSIAFGKDQVVNDFSDAGGRLAGSVTLTDSTGSDTTVDVDFDVQVPDEVRDCSL